MEKSKTSTVDVVKINICKVINTQKQSFRCSSKKIFFRISQISQENTCVEVFFSNVAGLKACTFAKKRLQRRSFPVKLAKLLRTSPVAAYEFCSGGCVRIASVRKYIIISHQCIKVNVGSIAWCCIHSKIILELDS